MFEKKYIEQKIFGWLLFIISGIFLIIILFQSFYTIDAGERGILLTFGNPSPSAIKEGLHFKIPIAQSVVKMTIRTQKYEAGASAASKDLQIVTANIATNYHILPEHTVNIYKELGLGYRETVIQPMEQEVVKATTAQFTAEELITKREAAREKIKEVLTERLSKRGIIVEEVSITNFDFSPSFNDAIEAKVTAEQLKLKAERDLERIQVEAEQVKAAAIGQKEASIAQAQGQSESIRIIDEQLRKSPQYIDFLRVSKWDGKLPSVTGGVIPFFDTKAVIE